MSKQRKLYDVRYFGAKGSVYSRSVGLKGRLLERHAALRVVRRLKRSGVDAIAAPMLITSLPSPN